MLPVSGKKIFSSRWWALVFAAGIVWTAVDIADQAPKSADESNAADDDTRAVAGIIANM